MKKITTLLLGFIMSALCFAQSPIGGTTILPFEAELAPFYHGVASGDPTSESVIIWTRVSPDTDGQVSVDWKVCTDPEMQNEVTSGTTTTDVAKDYTVKIDVTGLSPETTYYYYFKALGAYSIVGRTRTTPSTASNNLKFAVVSCSNYEHGYFNTYEKISERDDLDAVIHLGDYIYEYDTSVYGNNTLNRANIPVHEIVETDDYRTRYSQYKLDKQLMKAHQQHPFICIWDDHESANDAYVDGAENHNPTNEYTPGKTEGSWTDRKNAAREAYFQWMPIRETTGPIYRKIQYGDLADLWLLDTRIEGREEQPLTNTQAAATYRTILGDTQRDWLIDDLKNSTANWKVVANQVIFSQLNFGFAAGFADGTPDPTNIDSVNFIESVFLDIWDGYPQERTRILDSIETNNIDNVIILSGDFHSTFAFDVAKTPVIYPNPAALNLPTPSTGYDPSTGNGSLAVEFVTPSVTSANFDENVGAAPAAQFEFAFNNDIPTGNPLLPNVNYNPHMKYVDLDQHGYFVLDLKPDSAQADWFFVNSILTVDTTEAFGSGYYTKDGENHLNPSSSSAAPKVVQPAPAPTGPFIATSIAERNTNLAVLGVYPNPTNGGNVTIHYAVNTAENVNISIVSAEGKVVKELINTNHQSGIYNRLFNISDLSLGVYHIQFKTDSHVSTGKLLIIK